MSVVFFTNDLLFSSRGTSVATLRSIDLSVHSDADELVERASTVPLKVILLDLGTSGLEPAHLVPQLRKLAPPPRAIVAFGPHVYEAKLAAARDAGCDQVRSRGEFHSRRDEILIDHLREPDGGVDSPARVTRV